jgi:hypothetical protein
MPRKLRMAFVLIPVMLALSLSLALVGCGGDSKASVISEMLDCQAKADPFFEESMMIMFPTANNLDDAKKQYISVSQFASIDELKVARDYACDGGDF